MIGKITGILESVSDELVMIDVNGVFYEIHCHPSTTSKLLNDGEVVTIYTDLMVREDLMQLVGFISPSEKALYKELLSVQGIGAKAALSIVGFVGIQGTVQAISLEDHQALKAAPFVGPKSAQRIVFELKSKIGKLVKLTGEADAVEAAETQLPKKRQNKVQAKETGNQAVRAEALSALLNLGYSQSEAAMAIATSLRTDADKSVEEVLKESLQILATN